MTKRAIRVARMFDGERLMDGGVLVLLDGGRIVDVQRGRAEAPEGWPVREEPNGTVLPGLVDAHVHLCADAGPDALGRLAERPETDLDAVVEASLRAHLAAGVTTVRDLGDRRGAVLRWRAREARDDLPTVVASGAPVTTVGGHCWSMGGEVSGVDGIREAVRLKAAAGADLVKVMASGGVFTPGTDTTRPQFTDQELTAALTRAHDLGLPVTVHAHALNAVEQALRVGVDGIEHCTCVTAAGAHVPDEVADRLAASGVAVCATLGTDPAVVTPPEVVAMAARAGLSAAALRDGAATLHRAGVRLVAGSDAGLGPAKPHGILPETLVEYVACGIPAAAALAAATSVGAEVCGLGRRKGRVRPGYEADLLVVDGDPASDISALRRPLAVYRAGNPVR
ncbi:imidazolonepropionase-like amidohydrolase [Micromonospora sp. A202]|uniref:amidohydrolase family protein n=1 Tax=Micromonospora sp. A202 TaxID=2572899 RepID=UPI001151AA79|nr:amidohydrolase family protein [Micromonospora sp. A202]TQJ22045.1 imidazolonepropionase-like amidohydrolase [Micromonospora sp. A202]